VQHSFRPVAVVAVQDAADLGDFRMMNMAAYQAIDVVLAGLMRHSAFKIADQLDRELDLVLQIGGDNKNTGLQFSL